MMNLYLRLSLVLAAALRGSPLGPLDVSRVRLRTMPGDLDLNGHMNNGRYMTLFDLGRIDLCVRNGMHRVILKNGWKPIVGSAMVRYRRSLRLGMHFQLTTRILGWDQRAVFSEHRIEDEDEVYAIGVIRGLFAGPDGLVPPERLARFVGFRGPPPPLPEAVCAWRDTEQDLLAVKRAG
jgi:acyl-CoA thioesterase FadM